MITPDERQQDDLRLKLNTLPKWKHQMEWYVSIENVVDLLASDEHIELEQIHQQLKAMRQMVDGLEKALAPLWHKLFEIEKEVQDRLVDDRSHWGGV